MPPDSTGDLQHRKMIVYMFCFYLFHLYVWSGRAEHVTASVGDTITLPCQYMVHVNLHSACWGQSGCVISGCKGIIIQTDGSKVTWRKSGRYQLLGNIRQGDVSLTITGVTEEDAGKYCCRVEIPGWFNDQKDSFDVKIIKRYEDTTHVTEQVTTGREEIFSTDDNRFNNFSTMTEQTTLKDLEEPINENQEGPPTYLAVYVIAPVLLILLISLLLFTWKFYKLKKAKADSKSSVIHIDALGSAGNQAPDNVYN